MTTQPNTTYEAKCRRCGNIVEFWTGISRSIPAIQNHFDASRPFYNYCKTCEKKTFWDLVSLTIDIEWFRERDKLTF